MQCFFLGLVVCMKVLLDRMKTRLDQMVANDLRLTFPILWLKGKRHVMIAPTEDSVKILPGSDLQATLIGARFIDIKGQTGHVRDAHSLGGVGPLFGLSVFITLRIVRVAIFMEYEPEPLPFDVVKTEVLNILSNHPINGL